MFVKITHYQGTPPRNVEINVHPDDVRRILPLDDTLRLKFDQPAEVNTIVVVQTRTAEENVFTLDTVGQVVQKVRRAAIERAQLFNFG